MDPDHELVHRALDGDEAAFRALYEKHAPRAHATATRLLGDPHRAADAVQEAFVKAHARLAEFAFAAPFGLWIHKIAVREALNAARGARRAEVRERASARPEGAAERAGDEARRLLDRLPEDLRAAMVLRYLHGFTYAEIADALDVPVGTVRSRIFDAHRRLRESAEQ